MQNIVTSYFQSHPEARDGVMKAWYAYHAPHFRCDPSSHNFSSALRESRCAWCGRSREDVRWDNLPSECQKRPQIAEIDDTIFDEEKKAFALFGRADVEVPKLVEKFGLSGSTLATLHHTHGFDPETVAGIVDVPKQMIEDYHTAMEKERELSRSSQVKKLISVQISP